MFICDPCGKRHLSLQGRIWLIGGSYGPCEFCGKVRLCCDINSGWDWAWKPVKKSKKQKIKTKQKGQT